MVRRRGTFPKPGGRKSTKPSLSSSVPSKKRLCYDTTIQICPLESNPMLRTTLWEAYILKNPMKMAIGILGHSIPVNSKSRNSLHHSGQGDACHRRLIQALETL